MVSYKNKSEKFTRSNQEFKRQYAHIYSSRLTKLTELLKNKVEEKWGKFFTISQFFKIDLNWCCCRERVQNKEAGRSEGRRAWEVCSYRHFLQASGKFCSIFKIVYQKIFNFNFFLFQELKPSILKDISEENQLAPAPSRSHFTDDSDILILEDEIQRIRLIGKIEVHKLVTGIVSAVLGKSLINTYYRNETLLLINWILNGKFFNYILSISLWKIHKQE